MDSLYGPLLHLLTAAAAQPPPPTHVAAEFFTCFFLEFLEATGNGGQRFVLARWVSFGATGRRSRCW